MGIFNGLMEIGIDGLLVNGPNFKIKASELAQIGNKQENVNGLRALNEEKNDFNLFGVVSTPLETIGREEYLGLSTKEVHPTTRAVLAPSKKKIEEEGRF